MSQYHPLELQNRFKFVFLGDQSVGKTSIMTRFIFDSFDYTYQPTIGTDFFSKVLSYENTIVRLHLWDTAGLEKFKSLLPNYIRNSHVGIVVYDITNRESFENIEEWINEIRLERENDIIIIVVGNKADLDSLRVVTEEEGNIKAKELGCIFFETSAKSGQNIKNLFYSVVSELILHSSKYVKKNVNVVDIDIGNDRIDKKTDLSICRC